MPTYDYVCTSCQNAWEEVQRITADPLTDCPKCGKATAKRQISGGNFILKGSGWANDLYSSAKPKAAEAKPDAASSSDAKPAASSGDSGGSSSSGTAAPAASPAKSDAK
jgi:putative FmdB family regulatory protein